MLGQIGFERRQLVQALAEHSLDRTPRLLQPPQFQRLRQHALPHAPDGRRERG
jgi:hypothetical protein